MLVDKVVKFCPVWNFLVPVVVQEWSLAKHHILSNIAEREDVSSMLLDFNAGITLGF